MAISQHSKKDRIGFVGLGPQGCLMARNLLISGQRVLGHDASEDARTRFSESGGMLARTVEELVRACPVVFTYLGEPESFIDLVETRVVPHAQTGQVIIDLGVVSPKQVRRFARQLARKGAALIDAPVSGGIQAAEQGTLRAFCGGDLESFNKVRALLEVICEKKSIVHCGPSGSGQIVKGVSQLAGGLATAGLMEAVAYGVNAGVAPEVLGSLLGGESGWAKLFSELCSRVSKGEADAIGISYAQFGQALDEALEKGFELPASHTLHAYLSASERKAYDDGRPSPSLWHELTAGAASRRAAARK